jgi:hypothetical protein
MLFLHPEFYLSSYILPRDPQERLGVQQTVEQKYKMKGYNYNYSYPKQRKAPACCVKKFLFVHINENHN